ncbi:MAG TPA: DUF4920 domain-containing protein [Candidatus Polarisedimenticolaceae bacterium]|nr:DUF4920 domain-containing protein [Candidatus Polarisedimenticolaceae bacterium]
MRFRGLRFLPVLLVLAVLPAVAVGGGEETFGAGVSGRDTIPISVLLADAGDYVGKTVRVEGVITGVCQKAGCWMTLAEDGRKDEIRVKVGDGVIVFPADGKGRRAIAEGVLTKVEMTLEQTVGYLQHLAEEQGGEFDAASVTEPMTLFQIEGTGALIR